MRVSSNMLYDSITSHLQRSTSRLQELYEQASSQKRINKPSDDPAGMARILDSRDAIKAFERYQANVDTAKGWLGTADKTLMEVQDILARMKELSVQAANGTMSADNRQAIALEVRQNFEQLISLANTRYEDKSVFAGHKVDGPAFTQGLQVSSNNLDAVPFVKSVSGSSDRTIQVRFEALDGGDTEFIGTGNDGIRYSYSTDGGGSWGQKVLNTGDTTLDLDGVQVEIREGYEVVSSAAGSLPFVDNVDSAAVTADTSGSFREKVVVRVDQAVDLNQDSEVAYSISTDGGKTFQDGYTAAIVTPPAGDPEATLSLGDGRSLRLTDSDGSNPGADEIDGGNTFVIKPATKLQISPAAIYQGDDRNTPAAEIETYSGTTASNFGVRIVPEAGSFDGDVTVQIDDDGTTAGVIEYRYSLDGGQSWSDHLSMDATGNFPYELELPGGKVLLENAGAGNLDNLQFTLHGSPVQQMRADPASRQDIHAHAMGELSENVLVRIDGRDDDSNPNNPPDATSFDLGAGGNPIQYSYSLDGGDTWTQGNTASNPSSPPVAYAELPVPGGMLKLAPTLNEAQLDPGDQFLIQPRTADMDTEIHQGIQLAMNTPGVEVFGGHYANESGLEPAFEEDQQRNLFLGLGKLVAGLETDDQEAIQQSLGAIDGAIDQVSRVQADIGARENRLDVSAKVLTDLEQNEKERKGRIEDVDFAELMTRISQQQTVYQAVMKTSAMIMGMSLMDYL